MSSHTTDLYVREGKFALEWPKSGFTKFQDKVDYLSALDIRQVVAVWETGGGERQEDIVASWIILSCYLVCRAGLPRFSIPV